MIKIVEHFAKGGKIESNPYKSFRWHFENDLPEENDEEKEDDEPDEEPDYDEDYIELKQERY